MNPVMIMVAPNGARKTRDDHPLVPLTVEETAAEAVRCHAAGASILHAHVRDQQYRHVLDVGLYRELIQEVNTRAPGMLVQITSEAVGIYSPEEQVSCIQSVQPQMTSMSLKELTSGFENEKTAADFFHWCQEHKVHVQHILYSEEELRHFIDYCERDLIPGNNHCILLVLGRYSQDLQSSPEDLEPFLSQNLGNFQWFVCAFGNQEQGCMLKAIDQGGHARVGFENNIYLPDGRRADHTADLVESLAKAIRQRGRNVATTSESAELLGVAN